MTGRRVISAHEVPVERVVVQPGVESGHTTHRTWGRFSLGQAIHAAAGVFLVVFGAIGTGRAGFGDRLGERTAEVMGITLSTVLALVSVGVGLVLLLAALSPSGRGTGGAFGVLLLVAGIIVVAGSAELLSDLHTEDALGWLAIVVGAAAVVGAVLPAHAVTRQRDTVDY